MEQCCGDTELGEFSKHLFQRKKRDELGMEDDSKAFVTPHFPIRKRLPS
jgi:hypothetical protein